jgi:hypothetical protein
MKNKKKIRRSGRMQGSDLSDLFVESVADDGHVVLRMPGGRGVAFTISAEMVPYYRRLIRYGGGCETARASGA